MTAPATPAAGRVGPDGWVLVVALALATLLPLSDAVGRPLGFHISGSAAYLQQERRRESGKVQGLSP